MQCAKLCNAQNCAIWHSFALYMGIALCTVLNKMHNFQIGLAYLCQRLWTEFQSGFDLT